MKFKVAILKVGKTNKNNNFVTHATVDKLISEYNEGKYKNKYFEDGSIPVFFNEGYMDQFPDENKYNIKRLVGKTEKFYVENDLLYADIVAIESPLTTGFIELLKAGTFLPVGLTAYYDDLINGETIITRIENLVINYPDGTNSFEIEFGIKSVEENKRIHIGTIEPKWELIPEKWTNDDLKEVMAFIIGAFTKYKDSDKNYYTDMNQDLCDYVRKVLNLN